MKLTPQSRYTALLISPATIKSHASKFSDERVSHGMEEPPCISGGAGGAALPTCQTTKYACPPKPTLA
eukprot:1100744-Rhodomonas_salina.2